MNKSIVMILLEKSGFPPDIRVEKECMALKKNGWKIFIITYNTGNQKNREIYDDSVEIIRITNSQKSRLSKILFYLNPYDNKIKNIILKHIRTINPSVVHVHDLIYLGTLLDIVKNLKLKIVSDLHENMPAAFAAYRSNAKLLKKMLLSFIYGYKRWKKYEVKWLKKVDLVLMVTHEAKYRFINNKNILSKSIIVGNTENSDTFPYYDLDNDAGSLTIIYVGSIGPHRGLDVVLKAFSLVRHNNIIFKIIGVRSSQKKELLDKISKLQIKELIEIHDWMPFDKVVQEIYKADFGIVPHNWTEHTNTTVPHKLYQYLYAGLPVIVSSCLPLQRIVEDHNVGIVFEAGNAQDLSEKINDIANGKVNMTLMSKNAKKASRGPLSWEKDESSLINAYNRLLNGK